MTIRELVFYMSLLSRYFILGLVTISLVACQSLQIEKLDSQAQNHRIQSLIFHFTAVDYKKSMWALKNSGQVSSHYLIPETFDESYGEQSLKIIQLVDEHNRAWHAGGSYWQGRGNLNDTSIGIEIVNSPSCHGDGFVKDGPEFGAQYSCRFPDFDLKQIELVIELTKAILARHPDIEPTRILGHSDVAPDRKGDPGPRFPWYLLYQHGIGAWYDDDSRELYQDLFELEQPSISLIQRALRIYGYKIKVTGELDQQTQDVLFAFQNHFVPWELTSLPSIATTSALFALVEKYHLDAANRLFEQYQSTFLHLTPTTATPQTQAIFRQFYGLAGQGELLIKGIWPDDGYLKVNGTLVNTGVIEAVDEKTLNLDIAHLSRDGKNVIELGNGDFSELTVDIVQPQISWPKNKAGTNTGVLFNPETSNTETKTRALAAEKGLALNASSTQQLTLNMLGEHIAVQLAINTLLKQGKLSLEDGYSDHFPEYMGYGREYRQIKHLFEHSSGHGSKVTLASDPLFYRDEKDVSQWQYRSKHELIKQALIQTEPYEFGLKSKQRYGLINDRLLGFLVKQITGESLAEYLSREVFKPLGLTSTFLVDETQLKDGQLLPYKLNTTNNELLVLMQLMLNEGGYGKASIWQAPILEMSYGYHRNNFECAPYLSDEIWYLELGNELMVIDQNQHLVVFQQLRTKPESSPIAIEQAEPGNPCSMSADSRAWLTELYLNLAH